MVKRVNSALHKISVVAVLAIGIAFMGHPPRTVSAQVLYGSIVGTLTDETGAVVPKAVVTVTNTSTGLSRQATTDEAGYYSIPNLPEGTYDLSVTAGGFRPYTQKGVSVSINTVTRADARIQLGALNEQVTVEASAAILQTTKSDVSMNLDARRWRTCRSPATATTSRSSISFRRHAGAVSERRDRYAGRALTTNVNGQERGANNTRVDGSADILVTMPHHAVYVPPVESIQEVNIATNNFDAEQGMTGGAAVTVITKSGTNEFRGSVVRACTTTARCARSPGTRTAPASPTSRAATATSTAAASAARSRRTSCSSSRTGRARSNA